MSPNPEHVDVLVRILALANNRQAIAGMAQNAIAEEVEQYLIKYGFQPPFSDENETDVVESNVTKVEWVVNAGSGHGGPRTFDDHKKAREVYEHEAKVPSYMGKGIAGGGSGFQSASIVRRTTIYDKLEKNR